MEFHSTHTLALTYMIYVVILGFLHELIDLFQTWSPSSCSLPGVEDGW